MPAPSLNSLGEYPHTKLTKLLGTSWPRAAYNLAVGEPQEPTPPDIQDALATHAFGYPPLDGTLELREAWARWLHDRDGVEHSPASAIACCGTREGLFSIIQTAALLEKFTGDRVLVGNPHYQIYSGAALLAGMQPLTYNLTHLLAEPRDYPLDQTRIVVLCNPDNPTGHVASSDDITRLLELALAHKFLVIVDEAYLDTWFAVKPDSALTVAHGMGAEAVEHLAVTHSLSKRSGLAQLRSGMMAGGSTIIKGLRRYRRYHGVALPHPIQAASVLAWQDTERSEQLRLGFLARRDAALQGLASESVQVPPPAAGMFVWLQTHRDEIEFCHDIYQKSQVVLLPGTYLCWPESDGSNIGKGFVRGAFVHDAEKVQSAFELVGAKMQA